MLKRDGILILGAVLVIVIFVLSRHVPVSSLPLSSSATPSSSATSSSSILDPSRVTKKFFGTYVTPKNSPVQPEKFTGYHTGIDFETTAAEAESDVPVPAFCDGVLLVKKYATGYGGVAVESCAIQGRAVTVVYGHLKLASITPRIGQTLKKGDQIAVLGKGYSTETDGERKHLHLGIHIGTVVNILGYVQKKSDLSGWLDPIQFFK